jgi:hypothetical protein
MIQSARGTSWSSGPDMCEGPRPPLHVMAHKKGPATNLAACLCPHRVQTGIFSEWKIVGWAPENGESPTSCGTGSETSTYLL